jgi:hypothetical protein
LASGPQVGHFGLVLGLKPVQLSLCSLSVPLLSYCTSLIFHPWVRLSVTFELMSITKDFMYHPLSPFTICIFRPLYFLHLNFVRSYCSWPPFHPLPFLNFHFIHKFQHELEATLSYKKTTMRSILKVLLHEQPLNSPKFQKLADFMLL